MAFVFETKRRQGTILHADVVGYCRHMACDARTTVAAVRSSKALLAEVVVDHGGRVVDMAGDSLLAVFPSEVSAVRAALRMQRRLRRGGGGPASIEYRIGVHAGELLDVDNALYGTTVNIAARLQAQARPGHVVVSGSTLERSGAERSARWAAPTSHFLKNIPGSIEAVEDLL